MNRVLLLFALSISLGYSEESIKYINIFSGTYQLPNFCKNYPRENDTSYNIYCDEPNFEYLISIDSDDKPCTSSDELKSNERVTYKIQKRFISHGLSFSQVKFESKHNGKVFVFRTISSDKECLTIVSSDEEALDLVNIGNWH